MPEELVSRLDRRAARDQISRSRLVREAVTAYLAADEDTSIAAAYQAGYSKAPFGTPDEWGDLEAFHDALAQDRTEGGQG